MIHPINIPEDLLSANPRRPQLFRPRPKVKISYGRDGRRIGPDGTALEPISPNSYWQDTFMRTFIRRLMPAPDAPKEAMAPNGGISHVDIVDLSPSPSSSEGKIPTFLPKLEKEDGGRKDSDFSDASNGSLASMPARPEIVPSSTEEEEAEGDGLVRMGNAALRPERGCSQRISRKAIKSMLKECCQRGEGDKAEEFARFDFSHLNLFEMANVGMEKNENEELELVPEMRGSRVWTSRRRQQKQVHFEENNNSNPFIRFNIASVKIRPAKKVEIKLEAHNSLQKELQFEVETHLHKVEGQKIGECLRVQNQVELLKPGKETPIHVDIALDERMRESMAEGENSGAEGQGQFILATMHGKVMGDAN